MKALVLPDVDAAGCPVLGGLCRPSAQKDDLGAPILKDASGHMLGLGDCVRPWHLLSSGPACRCHSRRGCGSHSSSLRSYGGRRLQGSRGLLSSSLSSSLRLRCGASVRAASPWPCPLHGSQ